MIEKCSVYIKGEVVDCIFMGIFQRSRVIDASPFIGGHPGGVVSGPVAVVKVSGRLEEVELKDVKFSKVVPLTNIFQGVDSSKITSEALMSNLRKNIANSHRSDDV